MNAEQTVLLVTYLASSAVMVACGIPLFRRRIGRNKWLGFRTKLSMSDDAMWYATNRAAGVWLIVTGIGTALAAGAASFIGMNDIESATLVTGGMLTGITLCVLASLAEQRRVLDERNHGEFSEVDAGRHV